MGKTKSFIFFRIPSLMPVQLKLLPSVCLAVKLHERRSILTGFWALEWGGKKFFGQIDRKLQD